MSGLEVFAGGQYGSEGKGAVAAWRARLLCDTDAGLMAIRVAGPNAGHTVIGDKGTDTSASSVAPHLCEPIGGDYSSGGVGTDRFAWRLRCVPVAGVVNPGARLALAAGSEIDPDVLIDEINALNAAGYSVGGRLMVDEQATVISAEHKDAERPGVERIGSTGKGIGAARAARLWRRPGVGLFQRPDVIEAIEATGAYVGRRGEVAQLAARYLRTPNGNVHVEGTQGYGLGLHAGHYPYCTSSDCRAIDFLAMAGISPWLEIGATADLSVRSNATPDLTVWVCMRPYPIRVAGNSGPLYGETSWEALGLPAEITTVTRKTRRVGAWDRTLATAAVAANGGPSDRVKVALTMFDQVIPLLGGASDVSSVFLSPDQRDLIKQKIAMYEQGCGSMISYLGTGPDTGIDLSESGF